METTNLTSLPVIRGYVQRNYSKGMKLKFETNLPKTLENYISQEEFSLFINSLNEIYLDSETLKLGEGCLACMTAYLLYCCIKTHKQKCLERASDLIANQNDLWKERGITIFDPITKGFRVLEIQISGTQIKCINAEQETDNLMSH